MQSDLLQTATLLVRCRAALDNLVPVINHSVKFWSLRQLKYKDALTALQQRKTTLHYRINNRFGPTTLNYDKRAQLHEKTVRDCVRKLDVDQKITE